MELETGQISLKEELNHSSQLISNMREWSRKFKVVVIEDLDQVLLDQACEHFKSLTDLPESLNLRYLVPLDCDPTWFEQFISSTRELNNVAPQVEFEFNSLLVDDLYHHIVDEENFENVKLNSQRIFNNELKFKTYVRYYLNFFTGQGLERSLKQSLSLIKSKNQVKVRYHLLNKPVILQACLLSCETIKKWDLQFKEYLNMVSDEYVRKNVDNVLGQFWNILNEFDSIEEDHKNVFKRAKARLYYMSYEKLMKLGQPTEELARVQEFTDIFYDPIYQDQENRVELVKNVLGKVSESFCLAKWFHVTLNLATGQTHSCHHPPPHTIPTEQLSTNPSVLHNTPEKKRQREKMLQGERPSECNYCWKIEKNNPDAVSDRLIKSSESWAAPFADQAVKHGSTEDVKPRYLEIAFSIACNLSCCYCHPFVSQSIFSEYETYGQYPHEDTNIVKSKYGKRVASLMNTSNEYHKAFWQWFPEVYSSLEVLRVTGGEPLLSTDLYELLNFLDKNPNPSLSLSINSNLSVQADAVNRLVEKVDKLLAQKKVKEITIWASLDTWGEEAEYIRHGLDLERFEQNLMTLLSVSELKVQIMCTISILSVFSFKDLITKLIELRSRYGNRPKISASYLHEPKHLSVFLLPPYYRYLLADSIKLMEDAQIFEDWEIKGLKTVHHLMGLDRSSDELEKQREIFRQFFEEYDWRKGTSIHKVFGKHFLIDDLFETEDA